jgi:hypothetical protein
MSVTTTTPSEVRNLTTVSAVVSRLQLSSVPDGMEQLVRAASGAIERYCGRIFAYQVYEETINGNDHDILLLTHSPIIGTPTVTTGGSPVTDFTVRDANAGTLHRTVGWARTAWVGWSSGIELDRMASEYPKFVVAYTAGYKLPGEADTTLPPDIEEAAIMTAMQWYRRDKRDSDIASKKVGDLAITYGSDSEVVAAKNHGIPAMARALLPRRLV